MQRIGPETRLIHYFLAVAEDLHFGRAATKLHVSQPAVSRGIQSLEQALGVPLFTRTGRSVSLTAAGKILRDSAPRAIEALARALDETRAAGLGQRGHLAVSFLPSARFVVLPAVQRFRTQFDAVHLSLHEALDEQQFADLATGRADLGVVRGHRPHLDLIFENLIDAQLCVALPAAHRLATTTELSYEDLAEENFVLWPRGDSPEGFDHVIEGCRRAGFNPRIAAETSEAQTVVALVAAGVGVSILGSSLRETAGPNVAFVPLRNEHDRLYLVWRADDHSAVRRDFATILADR